MYLEADAALDDIDPSLRHLPEVLAVRVKVYQALERWELMQVVAKKLVEYAPENSQTWVSWANATRHAESVEAARLILMNALDLGLHDASIPYHLACYECQLGNLEGAKGYLKRCFEIDPGWRLKALDDEDLEAVWLTIGEQ